jgi:hypothetical protein
MIYELDGKGFARQEGKWLGPGFSSEGTVPARAESVSSLIGSGKLSRHSSGMRLYSGLCYHDICSSAIWFFRSLSLDGKRSPGQGSTAHR